MNATFVMGVATGLVVAYCGWALHRLWLEFRAVTIPKELEEWHDWFAWYPVYGLGHEGWMWLRVVRRRSIPTEWVKQQKANARYPRKEREIGFWYREPDTWL